MELRSPESFGPYRILQKVGEGSYSEIFLAEKDGLRSALKRNKRHYRYDREVFSVLDQEAEILQHLGPTRFFPKFLGAGIIDDYHFLEMEFVDGLSISQLIQENCGLSPSLVAFIGHELCAALEIVHSLKDKDANYRVHGDLKLSNVMIDAQGQLKIIDLGIQYSTFKYTPLERLHDGQITPYSDIFAVGLILYELLYGKHLFGQPTKFEAYVRMRELRVTEDTFEGLPIQIRRILVRSLKQDSPNRYRSTKETQADLSQFLGSLSEFTGRAMLAAWIMRKKNLRVDISPMGRFLELDQEGYLVNECSPEKIVPPWDEIVEDVRRAYADNMGPSLHSIYLRGSTARGTAIPGISDVDTFAVCQGPPDKIPTDWSRGYYKTFLSKFPFVNGVDLHFIHLDDLFRGLSHFSYRFIIKVLAACIHGPNLAESIAKFKPSLKIAFFYHGNLREVLKEAIKRIERTESHRKLRLWSNYALRRVLRLGFAINIEREGKYTRDLFLCYQVFSKYYPEREPEMRKALHLVLNPPSEKEELLELLRGLGGWLVLESERIFAGRPPGP